MQLTRFTGKCLCVDQTTGKTLDQKCLFMIQGMTRSPLWPWKYFQGHLKSST